MAKILGLFFAFILLLAMPLNVSLAEEKVSLSDKEEAAVRNFVSALLETPISMVLKAELKPPKTTYQTEFVEEDLNNISDRFSDLIDFPKTLIGARGYDEARSKQKFFVRFQYTSRQEKWDPKISCGSWRMDYREDKDGDPITSEELIAVWYHPNEGTTKCPHNQGTYHPGTIAVSGTYSLVLDYKGTTPAIQILKGTWSYNCKYTDGSKSGSVPCEVKLLSWEGQYGKMVVPENKTQQKQKLALGLIGLGGLLAGGFYIFRKFH